MSAMESYRVSSINAQGTWYSCLTVHLTYTAYFHLTHTGSGSAFQHSQLLLADLHDSTRMQPQG